jgi:hypothetical protein
MAADSVSLYFPALQAHTCEEILTLLLRDCVLTGTRCTACSCDVVRADRRHILARNLPFARGWKTDVFLSLWTNSIHATATSLLERSLSIRAARTAKVKMYRTEGKQAFGSPC